MPLFECSQCGGRENTATSNYWDAERRGKPKLCSACDPEIGKWHDEFPQKSAVGMQIDQTGFLWTKEEVEKGMLPKHYEIVGEVQPRPGHVISGGPIKAVGYEKFEDMPTIPPQNVCRPLVGNVPHMENATVVACPHCGADCWKRNIEPDPLPPGWGACCTGCALRISAGQTPPFAPIATTGESTKAQPEPILSTDRICATCEYFDGGGMNAVKRAIETATPIAGDCHNNQSPRFTTGSHETCPVWTAPVPAGED